MKSVLPENYTRLEQSASGDRGGCHPALLQVQAQLPLETVLGPLLFLIFINDIVRSNEPVIKLFTEDAGMSLGHTNPDIRTETLAKN